MIFSSIYAKDDAKKYPKAIQTALDYLKTHDFTAMETGVYEIHGCTDRCSRREASGSS